MTALDWDPRTARRPSRCRPLVRASSATRHLPRTPANGGPRTPRTGSTRCPRGQAAVYARRTQPQYGGAFRSDPLRAPGAPQSHFAGEQLLDEIAYTLKMDPSRALRKQNIDGSTAIGARWLAALDAAGKVSSAGRPWPPHSGSAQTGDVRTVRGLLCSGRSRTRRSEWSRISR